VLRISERRSKLLGLDAPARVEVERITEHEFAEMARELLEATGVAGAPRQRVLRASVEVANWTISLW
jgi:hypothetical protein